MIVSSILEGHIAPNSALPSSRKLAKQLSVARNTVVYAYQHLVDEGFLLARERSGFYVNPEILKGRAQTPKPENSETSKISWSDMIVIKPHNFRQNTKPPNWYQYPFPFICGQYDRDVFPIADWRECSREASSINAIHSWAKDQVDQDNPELIDQIHKKILPRRGVWAEKDEILVTVGAQQGIYLAALLLLNASKTMGIENPGYVDAENTFSMLTSKVLPLAVDNQGLIPDQQLEKCDCIYTTPSHHYPSTVTMPKDRRYELLESAQKHNIVIIEDDYESEFNYVGDPTPALKSMDCDDRVIYIGSLSKTLAPGIRLGYLVASKALIEQARSLRRLILRHPPSNNQFIIAQFLKRGYHDALVNRLSQILHERWAILGDLLETHFPGSSRRPTFGGSAFWVEGPKNINTELLAIEAMKHGILFEPGAVFFHGKHKPQNFFRLGFSSIATNKLEDGVRKLADLF
ncbi:MAG: aminotransferase class I/II-fold pyridoxal phosphate-dependent enzyme [Gammaproteobacteria bacterium]|nr:aminotransferase class I/II-fold pyridoxal phosphate-dependent enzyme [Gammaproteobacteria bacterium]